MATTPMSSIHKRIVTMPAMDAPAWRTMALCGTSNISRTPNSGHGLGRIVESIAQNGNFSRAVRRG